MSGKVRVFAVSTVQILETLRERHDLWSTAAVALGRAVSAGAMMGAMLKGDEKLTIQIKGNGPLGQIVVDANGDGEVRGYVDNPHTDLPSNAAGKFDIAGAVGTEGSIYVIKDLGLKEPYRGSVPLVSGELGEDFTYYFAKSEQTPSAVALGVLVDTDYSIRAAGGFIIQILPGATDDDITYIEQKLSQQRPITEMLDQGMSLQQILSEIVPQLQISEQMDIVFRCQCSRERVEQMLISLGRDELGRLIEEDGQAEVVCHFCNEHYQFDREQLLQLKIKL